MKKFEPVLSSVADGGVNVSVAARTIPTILYFSVLARLGIPKTVRSNLGIGQDITKRKRLEAQLFTSQKMEAVGTVAGASLTISTTFWASSWVIPILS